MKVFIVEANYPKDFYNQTLDGFSVHNLLNAIGIKNEFHVALNAEYLKKAIEDAMKAEFDVLHLSSHGDDDGIGLPDNKELTWNKFADLFQQNKPSPALVMSSCCGAASGLSKSFAARDVRPPFIFGSTKELSHGDYCAAWAILYNRFKQDKISRKTAMIAMKQISAVVHDSFIYRRWDKKDQHYKNFPISKIRYKVQEVSLRQKN